MAYIFSESASVYKHKHIESDMMMKLKVFIIPVKRFDIHNYSYKINHDILFTPYHAAQIDRFTNMFKLYAWHCNN